MSSLLPRLETRLELLSLVLWRWVRGGYLAQTVRCPLFRSLQQSELLAQAVDAIHALLSLVPPESDAQVEDTRLVRHVLLVRMGRGV